VSQKLDDLHGARDYRIWEANEQNTAGPHFFGRSRADSVGLGMDDSLKANRRWLTDRNITGEPPCFANRTA